MPKSEFVNRIGKEIIRISPTGIETSVLIKNYEVATYLHDLISYGYTYRTPVTVHTSESTCVACEG